MAKATKSRALTEETSFDCAAGDGTVKKQDAVFVGDDVYHEECHIRQALGDSVEDQVQATLKTRRAERAERKKGGSA